MEDKFSVRVDLDKHALDRLLIRSPVFRDYSVDDSKSVIDTLNESYNSGVLYKRKVGDIADHLLQIVQLSGVFYLSYYGVRNTYIASTFKLLRLIHCKKSAEAQDVTINFSYNTLGSKRKR